MKTIELAPIKESTKDFEALETEIKNLFRDAIYRPVLARLGVTLTLKNAGDSALRDAIARGRVEYRDGVFTGKFGAEISKELRSIGAKFDRAVQGFKLAEAHVPAPIRAVIDASESRMTAKFAGIDDMLAKILPEKIAGRLKVSKLFDTTLWKTDRAFRSSVAAVTVAPELSDSARKKIADEWQNNMRLWVKDFTEKEIKSLRQDIQKAVFSGNRIEAIKTQLERSYGVTERKAKFLARQETSLLMSKFKESRYVDAGVLEYKWSCVAGSKLHPVRPWHKSLEGKTFRWDAPPVTSKPGEPIRRNNPGCDFNCRCFARPIVRFNK